MGTKKKNAHLFQQLGDCLDVMVDSSHLAHALSAQNCREKKIRNVIFTICLVLRNSSPTFQIYKVETSCVIEAKGQRVPLSSTNANKLSSFDFFFCLTVNGKFLTS
jgi:hypothetical protein